MSVSENKNSKIALLEAAKPLFIEKGYGAVSTREIAEAAGVNLGAIQYHFGSKAKLFLEVIEGLMEGSECPSQDFSVPSEINSKKDAALHLSRFIFSFFKIMLKNDETQPCRMMIREIFSPTAQDGELLEALTSTVVNDFMLPTDELLKALLKHLQPQASMEELRLTVQSIVGQCSYYLTHRPFAERLNNCNYQSSDVFERTAKHIAVFTLRGLNLEEAIINEVVAQVIKEKHYKN